jgi:hypothetical protein
MVSTTLRPLYPQERTGTHCTGGWVGPRAGLEVCEKSRSHRDFFFFFFLLTTLSPDLQPVAGRYTDWAIPAPYLTRTYSKLTWLQTLPSQADSYKYWISLRFSKRTQFSATLHNTNTHYIPSNAITSSHSSLMAIFVWEWPIYSNAPVSTGNTFQDLPRLRETADNTERYKQHDIRITNINAVKFNW